jgi:hypothetical protein
MYDIVKIRKDELKKKRELKPMECCEPMLWLPSISFNATELPEIKTWKVGNEYEMTIKVKMTSFSKNERTLMGGSESKENTNASFDILGIEPKSK